MVYTFAFINAKPILHLLCASFDILEARVIRRLREQVKALKMDSILVFDSSSVGLLSAPRYTLLGDLLIFVAFLHDTRQNKTIYKR